MHSPMRTSLGSSQPFASHSSSGMNIGLSNLSSICKPSELTANPIWEISSSPQARYRMWILPFNFIAPGLNTYLDSQWCSGIALRMGFPVNLRSLPASGSAGRGSCSGITFCTVCQPGRISRARLSDSIPCPINSVIFPSMFSSLPPKASNSSTRSSRDVQSLSTCSERGVGTPSPPLKL